MIFLTILLAIFITIGAFMLHPILGIIVIILEIMFMVNVFSN